MTTITVIIDANGKPSGATEKDERAWNRFKKLIRDGGPGEVFTLDYWFPRNGKFHRLHMAMMAQLFAAQEQFDNPDAFRKWCEVGAGYCDMLPGPKGKMMPFPKSISYKSLDDEGMREVHENIKAFARGGHFGAFLWPHLSEAQQSGMVEMVLGGFEVA